MSDSTSVVPEAPPVGRQKSYGQVLKSSALIGGSSAINIVLGIIRTKAMALILGPAGFGLLGLYNSIVDLTRTIAGIGIQSSGVRQIAEAVGTGDQQRISRTVTALRRLALGSGALGSVLLLIFSRQVSQITFGTEEHTAAVALLAIAVFLGDVSAAQGALVQGMRRVADLARISILGALYGTVIGVPVVYFLGERGLVPSIICVAGMGILTSWWYARKVKVERVSMTFPQLREESSALVKLGVAFMASSLFTLGAGYVVRTIVLRKMGVDAAGFYQAAWTLGGLYVSFILQAMGADFYPRLTGVASDHPECNRLVNEQAEVGLLLAGPGILATLVLAPTVIDVFYSHKFDPAVEILRWICLGMLLRVASWPMGFIVLAKGERKVFFWAELLSNLCLVGLVYICMLGFGLAGTGMGFFGMYALYWIGIYAVVRRLTGFRWSAENWRLSVLFVPIIAVVFVSWYFLPRWMAVTLGLASTVATGVYSARTLCRLVPAEKFPPGVRRILKLLKLWSGAND